MSADMIEQAFAEGHGQGVVDFMAAIEKRLEWMIADYSRRAAVNDSAANALRAELKELQGLSRRVRPATAKAEG